MNFQNIFNTAFTALRINKLRTILTVLGIVIGISSVIMMLSASTGLKSLVLAQLESWGSDWIEVEVKVPGKAQASADNGGGQAMGISITTLKEEDGQAILKHPNIKNVYSAVLGQAVVVYKNEKDTVNLWGVNASYVDIDPGEVAVGRFFTDDEDKSLARVIVLGPKLKEKLFGPAQEAIGKYVKVGRHNFKVIGIMESKGAIMYLDMDEMAYVPLRVVQKQIMGIDHVSFIVGQLRDMKDESVTVSDITYMIRERHQIDDPDKDDFAIVTMEDTKKMLNTVLGGLTLLLVAIAAVSLAVGGVGIMNIMYVSVSERINEIGLRKAVGASSKNILWQFLVEAVILTVAGGLFGVLLGALMSFAVYLAAQSQNLAWSFSLKPISVILAVGVSMLIGLIFGIYPAKKAAKLDPIKALGFE